MQGLYPGLLALLRELVGSPSQEALLTAALDGALRLIPGAQAGSSLLREGDVYRLVAVRGHHTAPAPPVHSLSLQDGLCWYGGSLQEALQARPKLLWIQPEFSGLLEQDRHPLWRIHWSFNIPVPLGDRIGWRLGCFWIASSPPPFQRRPWPWPGSSG